MQRNKEVNEAIEFALSILVYSTVLGLSLLTAV